MQTKGIVWQGGNCRGSCTIITIYDTLNMGENRFRSKIIITFSGMRNRRETGIERIDFYLIKQINVINTVFQDRPFGCFQQIKR